MNNMVELGLLVEKTVADEVARKEIAEIALRRADAKFKAMVKCKVLGEPVGNDELLLKVAHNVQKLNLPKIESIRGTLRNIDINSGEISNVVKNMSIQFDGVLGSLKSLKNISYLNTGISLANLAVDVAGFMVISDKLTEIDGSLNRIDSNTLKLLGIAKNDLIQEYENHLMKARHIYSKIINDEQTDLEQFCGVILELRNFIQKLINHSVDNTFDEELLSEMIFTLMPAYTFLLSEYTKQYYFQKHRKDVNYDNFISLYDKLANLDIIKKLFDHLILDSEMSIIDATDAVNAQVLFALNNKVQIEDNMRLIEILDTKEKLSELDKELKIIMKDDIQKDIPKIVEECEIEDEECRRIIDALLD